MKVDTAIIGGGVVGCAIARRLATTQPGTKIVVLEKLESVGLETSSLNSGVLHSGIHQNPNFLKSKLAKKGSKIAACYMKIRSIPIMRCGMLIVVSSESLRHGLYKEWLDLWRLIKRGQEQKIDLKFLTPFGIRKIEPNIKALGGIFIPNVWVVDPAGFTNSLYQEAKAKKVEFFFKNPVLSVSKNNDSYCLATPSKEFFAKKVVNAAGLYADEVAKMAGFAGYKIYPWRGEYYEVIGEKKKLVSRLVYPALPANYPGKGIHFSPRVDERLFIGPNARPVPRKNFYTECKTPVEEFLKTTQKFCPQIKEEDLVWAYSGIRPKLTNAAEESDFIIRLDNRNPHWLNLIGIESPGLSSAMATAEYVEKLLNSPPG
ncbi:MAG: NAD(P)/FAD-dependent oxidoreductase [Candidatus Yanofskybacteria bacterium]|nr:NAD(P)/FAD-dependent oxidoreductase [Candidatus Yanofskybacteria bacterium]